MSDKNPSNNHDLPRPANGTFDGTWGTDIMNDDLTQKLEERLVARDTESNLSNYTPYDEAIFIATDTGAVYDGDGSNWSKADRDFNSVTTGSVENGGSPISVGDILAFEDSAVASSLTLIEALTSGEGLRLLSQPGTDVGTSATEIVDWNDAAGAFALIIGADQGSNALFVETVLVGPRGAGPTVGTTTVNGSVAARTYSTDGDNLNLAMGSGTYGVSASVLIADVNDL